MTRLNFICEFKSDIVLHSSSNTEGKVDRFNYIAGSNFLGMVARAYSSFGRDAFDVFHSGKVRFLDGHIVENEQKTFHAPLSWFAPKGFSLSDAIKKKELYNNHFITSSEYEEFIQDKKQLKQQRGSFITEGGKVAKLNSNYRQKSAYDKDNRRSRNSSMFGYYALEKGTKWAFEVEMEDAKHKDEIIKLLESSNRLGKSRSAEYGRVKINFVDEKENSVAQVLSPIIIDEKSYIFIYAHSRLALMNDYGVNSYQLTISSLKLDEGCKIDWDKSQVRTSRYTPYVSIRHNRDPERLIIDKGSVIAIEVNKDFDVEAYSQKVQKGLGLYLSEGHGQVVVNPSFLNPRKPNFEEAKEENSSQFKKGSIGLINKWLEQQQEEEKLNYKILKEVKVFISNHNVKNKKAQWGQVRSLTRAAVKSDDLHKALFDETMFNGHPKGFLLHGQAKDKWDSKLMEALRDRKLDNNYHGFIKILSIYAPKEDDKKGEKKDV